MSKKKQKIKYIYDPILEQNYYMLIGVSAKRFVTIVRETLKLDLPMPDGCGRMTMLNCDGIDIPLIWTVNRKPENIAHECFHAVDDVFRDRGITLSSDSCESYAYTLSWLMREALEKK